MAIAAIGSIGGAFQAASAFLGWSGTRAELPVFVLNRRDEVADEGQDWQATSVADGPDPAFAPGASYFEAVAAALGEAGYLDA